jgi:hypothetical protein
MMGGRSIGMIAISNEPSDQDLFARAGAESRIGNHQKNLLFLVVDQLASPEPVLVGIWLLITHPEFPNLTLVPVFSPNPADSTVEETNWLKLFSMTAQQTLSNEFIAAAHNHILWDRYLIIDQKGIEAGLNILQQIGDRTVPEDISTHQSLLPTIGSNFNLKLDSQIELWKMVCREVSPHSELSEIEGLFQQITPFIRTDLDRDEIGQYWPINHEDDFQFGCEFPTLTLNNP